MENNTGASVSICLLSSTYLLNCLCVHTQLSNPMNFPLLSATPLQNSIPQFVYCACWVFWCPETKINRGYLKMQSHTWYMERVQRPKQLFLFFRYLSFVLLIFWFAFLTALHKPFEHQRIRSHFAWTLNPSLLLGHNF